MKIAITAVLMALALMLGALLPLAFAQDPPLEPLVDTFSNVSNAIIYKWGEEVFEVSGQDMRDLFGRGYDTETRSLNNEQRGIAHGLAIANINVDVDKIDNLEAAIRALFKRNVELNVMTQAEMDVFFPPIQTAVRSIVNGGEVLGQ